MLSYTDQSAKVRCMQPAWSMVLRVRGALVQVLLCRSLFLVQPILAASQKGIDICSVGV